MRSFIIALTIIVLANAQCDTCNNGLAALQQTLDVCGVDGIYRYHANDFNLVALGYSGLSSLVAGSISAQGGGDVEGRLLAADDLLFTGAGGYSIGDKIVNFPANAPFSQKAYSAIVGGSPLWLNGQLNPFQNDSSHIVENGVWFTSAGNTQPWMRFAGCNTGNVLDLTDFRLALQDLSTTWANAPATASYTILNNGQTIALNGAGQAVCDYLVRITAADWNAHHDFLLQNGWNVGANVVIDIVCAPGDSFVWMSQGEFPGLAGNVVYNLGPSCTDVTINAASVTGSILAPWSILNQDDGRIWGNVYVGQVANFLQINVIDCPPNPEACDCCNLCATPTPIPNSKCGLINALKNKN